MPHSLRPSPALVVAGLALFFALGGSAFALGKSAGRAEARCGAGTVRGIATVVGDPHQGIANLPTSFSASASLFSYRWNCSGGAIEVRKSDRGGFDIRFAGNPSRAAVANAATDEPAGVSVSRNPDGSLHVSVGGAATGGAFSPRNDMAFTVVVL